MCTYMSERKKKWSEIQLVEAVKKSSSLRGVIFDLGLIPAGGNYEQVKKYIREKALDTSHFTGRGWRTGLLIPTTPAVEIEKILVKNSLVQSYKLKKRLFKEGLKTPACEECRWNKKAEDGRLPLELDHINGDRHDNRLENLRILCPNCHSLKPTHRGRKIKRRTLLK
jgi:hypothetical protein